MSDGERRYSEDEFALILRRAAEMHEGAPQLSRGSGGLTLREMQSIAQEAGIDPGHVERAALTLSRKPVGRFARFMGGPTRVRFDTTVDSALSEDAYPDVLEAIRAAAEAQGEIQNEFGGLAWRSRGDATLLSVTVRPDPDDETTRLVVASDWSGAAMLGTVGPIMAGVIGGGILGAIVEPSTVLGGVGLMAGTVSAGVLTARALWKAAARRFRRKAEDVVRRLTAEVEDRAGR
ncbi:MAG: hypothetical protein PVJ02_14240 [Gemmatimonadota bacterium]|jgi:hypothetical protein